MYIVCTTKKQWPYTSLKSNTWFRCLLESGLYLTRLCRKGSLTFFILRNERTLAGSSCMSRGLYGRHWTKLRVKLSVSTLRLCSNTSGTASRLQLDRSTSFGFCLASCRRKSDQTSSCWKISLPSFKPVDLFFYSHCFIRYFL